MSLEQPKTSPPFRFDPADMEGLRRALTSRPDAASLPTLNMDQVEAGADALLALPTILRRLARDGSSAVLLVQDRRPFWREGTDLKPFVRQQLEQAGFQVEMLEMGDAEGYLHSDFEEVEQIRPHLRPDKTAVALGSGKICDVTKHACFEHEQETGQHIPFVVVQTANSVIAFGSGMATITKDGVKRTWPSRLPDVLLLDSRILRDAPFEYTVGGIGDLAVIAVSFGDWYLGAQLGLSKYTQASFDILQDVRSLLFSQAAAFASRSLVGMETLAKLSALGGFAMTLAKSSAPMSGYEHAISHMLDMSAEHYGRQIASHGCQCGISTIACAIAWRKWLWDFQPDQVNVEACFPSAQQMQQRVQATFNPIDPSGAMAAECWNTYSRKLEGWHQARPQFEALLRDWSAQRARLDELVHPPETVVDGLSLAQHPLRYEDLGITESQARWAFKNGHMMRQRFSSADLLHFVGLLDDAFVDDVFRQMRTLVSPQTHVV